MFDPGFPAKSLAMVKCLSSVARVYASGHDRIRWTDKKGYSSNKGWVLNNASAFWTIAYERPTVSTRNLTLWRVSNVNLEQYQVYKEPSCWMTAGVYKENGGSPSLLLTNFLWLDDALWITGRSFTLAGWKVRRGAGVWHLLPLANYRKRLSRQYLLKLTNELPDYFTEFFTIACCLKWPA